jgi:hypothetical protein
MADYFDPDLQMGFVTGFKPKEFEYLDACKKEFEQKLLTCHFKQDKIAFLNMRLEREKKKCQLFLKDYEADPDDVANYRKKTFIYPQLELYIKYLEEQRLPELHQLIDDAITPGQEWFDKKFNKQGIYTFGYFIGSKFNWTKNLNDLALILSDYIFFWEEVNTVINKATSRFLSHGDPILENSLYKSLNRLYNANKNDLKELKAKSGFYNEAKTIVALIMD